MVFGVIRYRNVDESKPQKEMMRMRSQEDLFSETSN